VANKTRFCSKGGMDSAAELARLAGALADVLAFEYSEGQRTIVDPGVRMKPPPARAPAQPAPAPLPGGSGSAVSSATSANAPAPAAAFTVPKKKEKKPIELLICRAHRLPECGDGDEHGSPLLLIAEPPSFEASGRETLDKMLYAIGFKITTEVEPIRRPREDEARPLAALTFGHRATDYIVEGSQPFDAIIGTWHKRNGMQIMPLLDTTSIQAAPGNKRRAWNDLLGLLKKIGLPLPEWSQKYS